MDQKHNRSTATGFTLVELLVVIGIIGLLVAILLPALQKARKLGMQTRCAASMRELGNGLLLYYNEHGGHFPGQIDATDNTPTNTSLGLLFSLKYIRTAAVFHCPADRLTPYGTDITTNNQNANDSSQQSYLYRYYAYYDAKKKYYMDRIHKGVERASVLEDLYGGKKAPDKFGNHSPDGGNVLFLDNHVEWHRPGWNASNYSNGFTLYRSEYGDSVP